MIRRCLLPAALTVLLAAGAAVHASAEDAALAPAVASLPGSDDPAVAALWRRALDLERRRDHAAAAATYEQLSALLPASSAPRWRAAKNHWNAGRRLPASDPEARRRAYGSTLTWARRGLDVDPDCGECCLYAAAGLGGEARDGGAIAGAMLVSEIAALLERGIPLVEQRRAPESDSELEELYYAAALLYRSVPDSNVLRWALGVPGDRRRAIEYMRRATALGNQRADYQVELASLLVCTGRNESDTALMAEGLALLHAVQERPAAEVETDVRARAHAILEQPQAACD